MCVCKFNDEKKNDTKFIIPFTKEEKMRKMHFLEKENKKMKNQTFLKPKLKTHIKNLRGLKLKKKRRNHEIRPLREKSFVLFFDSEHSLWGTPTANVIGKGDCERKKKKHFHFTAILIEQ